MATKMLKVVGASWWQTRLSSYILGSMAIFAVFVLILGELGSRVEDDGIYSASVFWPSGYRIEFWGQNNILEEIPFGVARAYFQPDKGSSGWSVLEIETNPHQPDWKQAFSAGLLEGSLSWQMIYWHWQNTIEPLDDDTKTKARKFLQKYSDKIRSYAEANHDTDPFWHQINLFYFQLDGLEAGFNYAVARNQKEIFVSNVDFLWMNCPSDLAELLLDNNGNVTVGSSFVKLLWDRKTMLEPEVVVSHSSEGSYGSMLRMLKKYKFNFHVRRGTHRLVPGREMIFSGYPAAISSQDDFYTVADPDKHHHLVVSGTRISGNFSYGDDELLKPKIFVGIRALVANRLAADGKSWSKLFANANSGTGNKQWQIINLSKLRKLKRPETHNPSGILWIVEQIPGAIHSSDQSHQLVKTSYWANRGQPHSRIIREKIALEISKEHRDSLFDGCIENCSSLNDVEIFVKNRYYLFEQAVNESRKDLAEEPDAYGVIDTKTVLGFQQGIKIFKAQSGPLWNETMGVEPFSWSKSKFQNTTHFGQPDLWNYPSFQPTWIWI